jgi:hypothetical protein
MMGKKDTSGLYWFRLKTALRPVRKERLVLSCTEVLVAGVTKWAREGGVPRSQDGSEVCVQLCWNPRKVQESCVFV